MAAVTSLPRRWFFGPIPDLLFGCGLLYATFFAAQSLAGPTLRSVVPLTWLPMLLLVFGAPHYGATLLRVYEQAADRRRYAFFAVYVSIVLAALYVVGLQNLVVGSLLITLYLTWSPWHYSGQNFGVAMLFLRRRGVAVSPSVRRLLQGSFVLSYAATFLALHAVSGDGAYAPESLEGTRFRLYSLGFTPALHVPLLLAVGIGYLACVGAAVLLLLRRAHVTDLAPTTCVVLMQALWFALPTVAAIPELGLRGLVEPLAPEHRPYAFMWIAVGHFVQYLWVTTFYAAASENSAGHARYLLHTLLAGTALWVLPTLLFAPGVLGQLPFDMGLGLLTASVVNIHHFILDGAIWKLRDGRIARVLLRDPAAGAPAMTSVLPAGRGRLRSAVFAIGAACWLLSIALFAESQRAEKALAQGDLRAFEASLEHRAWLGRDSPRGRLRLARLALREGDANMALANARRAGEMGISVETLRAEGQALAALGRPKAAHRARALAAAIERASAPVR